MGQGSSLSRAMVISELEQTTVFTRAELITLYKHFHEKYPSGEANVEDVADECRSSGGRKIAIEFVERIHRAKFGGFETELVMSQNVCLDLREFVLACSAIRSTSVSHQLIWAYHVMSDDLEDGLDRNGCAAIIDVLISLDDQIHPLLSRETAIDQSERLFDAADTNKDGYITDEEFIAIFSKKNEPEKSLRAILEGRGFTRH